MRAIIDSDVMIDYLQGLESARIELGKYAVREASMVSWMEVMAGAETPQEESDCARFLETFRFHDITREVAAEAVALRKAFRLKLPDAIIWATARTQGCLVVTRNTKDYPLSEPGIRIPYSV